MELSTNWFKKNFVFSVMSFLRKLCGKKEFNHKVHQDLNKEIAKKIQTTHCQKMKRGCPDDF